jgi:4'-phosphopantetheinyl transferase
MNIDLNDIHVWYLDLNLFAHKIDQLQKILCEEELRKAFQFRFEKHQNRFIITRGVLKIILSKYIDIEPEKIEFVYTQKGKPSFVTNSNEQSIEFNVSHSSDLALYAIAKETRIGIDVEKIKGNRELESIAKRFFCPREYQFISSLKDQEKEIAFYQAWTSKEAYLKATGEGLAGGLDAIELDLASKDRKIIKLKREQNNIRNWYLYNLDINDNYIATLAVNKSFTQPNLPQLIEALLITNEL